MELAKSTWVIVFEYGHVEVEEALKTLRSMSESFNRRQWEPRRTETRDFIVSLMRMLSTTCYHANNGGVKRERPTSMSTDEMERRCYRFINFQGCYG